MSDEIEIEGIKTPTDFMIEIEKLVVEKRVNYIDAVVLFCEQRGMEVETAATLIKGSAKMKAKVQNDAEELNYLPKTRKLPI
jgi:phosphopantetheine adenylyltransferase